MRTRARAWWRVGLTAVAVALFVVAAISCREGLFLHYSGTAYVDHDASIVRGALHVASVDRRPISARLSRMPELGWRARLEAAEGRPLVEWTPAWNASSAGLAPGWALRVPLWIPIVLIGAPAAWMWWRATSRPGHLCPACGYDLRGSSGGVCPECGARVPQDFASTTRGGVEPPLVSRSAEEGDAGSGPHR